MRLSTVLAFQLILLLLVLKSLGQSIPNYEPPPYNYNDYWATNRPGPVDNNYWDESYSLNPTRPTNTSPPKTSPSTSATQPSTSTLASTASPSTTPVPPQEGQPPYGYPGGPPYGYPIIGPPYGRPGGPHGRPGGNYNRPNGPYGGHPWHHGHHRPHRPLPQHPGTQQPYPEEGSDVEELPVGQQTTNQKLGQLRERIFEESREVRESRETRKSKEEKSSEESRESRSSGE